MFRKVFSPVITGVFEGSGRLLEREGYHIQCIPETGGLCNAIIYQNIPEFANLEEVAVGEDVRTADEFKEIPLHLRNRQEIFIFDLLTTQMAGVDQDVIWMRHRSCLGSTVLKVRRHGMRS